MVEHHDKCWALACAVENIGDIGIGEVANLERNALVSAMARQRIELRARHILNADARSAEVIDQTRQSRIALPALGDERALDGKAGTQRLGGSAAAFDKLALGDLNVVAVALRTRRLSLGAIVLLVAAITLQTAGTLVATAATLAGVIGTRPPSLAVISHVKILEI